MKPTHRWLLAASVAAALSSRETVAGFATPAARSRGVVRSVGVSPPAMTRPLSSSASSSAASPQPVAATPLSDADGDKRIAEATVTLQNYDKSQLEFVKSDGEQGMGGGLSALHHIQSLSPDARTSVQEAVRTLVYQAHGERAVDSSKGRIMLGFCASNAPEALSGLKSWVSSIDLPRGMLHGMDVDGVPIPVEELGAVYVKYSTGGAMTFTEMRKSGRGFDALWRPGDALLETYDGDFRGVYLNVELGDGEFRQFGVLPTDLFMEEEEW